jgi:hypothetical protein
VRGIEHDRASRSLGSSTSKGGFEFCLTGLFMRFKVSGRRGPTFPCGRGSAKMKLRFTHIYPPCGLWVVRSHRISRVSLTQRPRPRPARRNDNGHGFW